MALLAACAVGNWRSRSADKPLTPSELASRNLSVADRAHDPALYARTLAVSQGTADFVRNSGTPQQKSFSGQ